MKETPMDDFSPKERELKAYLEHLVTIHGMTDLQGDPNCWRCDNFKKALS